MSSDDRITKGKRRPRSVDGVVQVKQKKTTVTAPADSMPTRTKTTPQHRRPWLRRSLWIGIPVVGLIGAIWIAGNVYGMRYVVGGDRINARAPKSSVEQLLTHATQDYRLKIADSEDNITAYSFQDMGIQPDIAATITSLHKRQQAWPARLQWWKPITLRLRLQTDTVNLQKFVKEHAARTIEPAKDAAITLENGEIKLVQGKTGKQYGLSNPDTAVLTAAERLQTAPLRMHKVDMLPAITASQLTAVRKSLERTLHQKIAIKVGDQTVEPQPKDIAGWVRLIPDVTRKTITVESNKEGVQIYLDNVAAEHFQPPKAQLTNGAVTIPGVAGVRVTGTQAAAATISDKLLANRGLDVELPVQRTSYRTVSAPLAGRWIVVDLTTKRMYAYQQTNLAKSFLISAGMAGTPTPTGRYAIYSKYARQTMSGPNADGSHYVQPNVPWVNYFYRDFAIHGNYWRPASYFGNVHSSHGCVGLTPADAAWVYNWAVIGTPVIIHY